MARCLYSSSFKDFLHAPSLSVLGTLHSNYHGETLTTTNDAWEGEINILQEVLKQWENEDAHIIFEYDIPRLGKRIDTVLLLRGVIFCLEFKIGQNQALQNDLEQVLDYALDLKNFHLFSADRQIVPILVPSRIETATTEDNTILAPIEKSNNPITQIKYKPHPPTA